VRATDLFALWVGPRPWLLTLKVPSLVTHQGPLLAQLSIEHRCPKVGACLRGSGHPIQPQPPTTGARYPASAARSLRRRAGAGAPGSRQADQADRALAAR